MDDPKHLSEPRTKAWIEQRASELERDMRLELIERWPKHPRYTQTRLVEEVAEKHLNGFWGYEVQEVLGQPPRIRVVVYHGQVDEGPTDA
jgi:hypothetical protein